MGDLCGDHSLEVDDDDDTSHLTHNDLNSLIQHEDSMDNLDSGTGEDLWDNGTTDDVNSVVQSPTTPGHDEGINSPSEENLYQTVTQEVNTARLAKDVYDMIVTESIDDVREVLEKVDVPSRQKVWDLLCKETVKDDMTLVQYFVSENMLQVLQLFDDISINLNTLDSNGNAAIHYAVKTGNLLIIDFLTNLKNKEVTEGQAENSTLLVSTSPEWKTPLHLAAEEGENFDVIDLLLEGGARVNARDALGNTPLHLAAKAGSVCLPEKLLDQGAFVNLRNDNGETALYLACEEGHAETAVVLTNYKADVNVPQEKKWTPLHIACHKGHTVIIYQLLDVGADPFCLNADNKMPIHYASKKNLQSAVRRMLFRRGSSSSQELATPMVFKLAQSSSEADFMAFKECIGNINAQNLFGQTALHYAARAGDLYALRSLLKSGGIVDIEDRNGNTPLHLALIHKHFEIAKALALQCRNINQSNKKKENYIFLAVTSGNLDLVEYLLDCGAYVNSKMPRGDSLLSHAIQTNSLILLEKLLMYGANMNVQMMHGITPLHAAAKLGNTDICKMLLCHGCSVNIRENVVKRTALHLAAESGHLSTVVELLTHGADVNATDTFHKKPLHLAAAEGHKDVVEVLLDTGTRVLLCDDSGSVEYDLARHQEIWDIIREWIYNQDPSAVPAAVCAPPPVEEAPPSYHALTFISDE